MRKPHPSRKTFGDIFALTFEVYFKDFWRNLGYGMLISCVVVLFSLPYIAVFASSVNIAGYPFMIETKGTLFAFKVSFLLFLAAAGFFAPSFLTSYLGPKTLEHIEQKKRDKKAYLQLTWKVFGRTSSAQAAFSLVILILLEAANAVINRQLADTDMMSMVSGNEDALIVFLSVSFLFTVAWMIVRLFSIFAKQIALFEHRTWFGAVLKSAGTIASGNFWATIGYYILFGLIIGFCTLVIVLILSAVLLFLAAMVLGVGALAGIVEALSDPVMFAFAAIVLVLVFVVLVLGRGLHSVFTTLVYFNARTQSENIPFPEPEMANEEKL